MALMLFCFMVRMSRSSSSAFGTRPEAELKSLMTACLNHAEVLLPAGYQPVMTGSEWACRSWNTTR